MLVCNGLSYTPPMGTANRWKLEAGGHEDYSIGYGGGAKARKKVLKMEGKSRLSDN